MTSSGDASAQATIVSAFEALVEKSTHPKTGKPLIQSFKCGKQNSPEGKTKGLEMVFVLEFEVRPFLLYFTALGDRRSHSMTLNPLFLTPKR